MKLLVITTKFSTNRKRGKRVQVSRREDKVSKEDKVNGYKKGRQEDKVNGNKKGSRIDRVRECTIL